MKTNERGGAFEDPGKTAASMMRSMNRVMLYLRDQRREHIETTKGLHGGHASRRTFRGTGPT
jgi:hypothetical protein